MPPSDCGVHEPAEFAIEYANFSLFSERFFTYPILSSFPSQSLALCAKPQHMIYVVGSRWRSKQIDGVHMDRLAYPLSQAAPIAGVRRPPIFEAARKQELTKIEPVRERIK